MTDRDRLAADLRTATNTGPADLWLAIADRLIDLGWARLDEERLARALTSYAVAVWMGLITDADTQRGRSVRLAPGFASDFAAAIAKAYREDSDAAEGQSTSPGAAEGA